jgi:hypothetical protein
VKVLETTSGEYYGKGYQDTQHRVPKITNTMADLDWAPKVTFETRCGAFSRPIATTWPKRAS